MIRGINVCMIEVQIYYTVYDRSTTVRYVLQQEYAVGMIQICLADNGTYCVTTQQSL